MKPQNLGHSTLEPKPSEPNTPTSKHKQIPKTPFSALEWKELVELEFQNSSETTTHMKNVVLGIGTGRCGTLAFSKLLNRQPYTVVTHEYGRCGDYAWKDATGEGGIGKAEKRYQKYWDRLNKNTGGGRRYNKVAGDIALWNLPYKKFKQICHNFS